MSDELTDILDAATQWRTDGHGVALATVIATWGSAPRRVGSHLLIRDDGLFLGSVSGGCVEGAVLAEAPDVIDEAGFRRLDFGVADETAWEVGLACGGRISVLLQAIADSAFPPALLGTIAQARSHGTTLTLSTDLATGRTTVGDAPGHTGVFTHRYDPPLRLILVGAVHIAQSLVPLAEALGFTPLIVDPRGAFAAGPRFAGHSVDSRWPDEALADWQPDSATAIVALTHDPKLDDPALAAALRSDAFYVAALGSRKNHAARRERLAAQGFTPQQLDRIHGPAGLAIGAANPAEIALSIAAQMIATWRQAP
ncbi:XdhC family protein [Sandaracinobacteroides saxicola]|uniref:XdhC family protein n=1 Tax=Sandaracinobacteroides saxicola TaxID=2759707 RepID=A0A7G5IK48_9SPHN|nr:XdhC family protein [Sandaracinobacteroides saxicola]QMW23740.1 XdhC family protein [Sandaracinobacteroides saxicola]